MPGKDSKYIEFTKWRNRGRGTMGEFKFKDTVENLKTNLLDNLGRWVPTAIAANGIINGIDIISDRFNHFVDSVF